MDHEQFFSVVDNEIVDLECSDELPTAFTTLIAANLERLLGHPALTIGVWPGVDARPDVLALDADGSLISILLVGRADADAIEAHIKSIDEWLKPLELRDLGLLDDALTFYEGLLDLSPHASVRLAGVRNYVLLTALEALDIQGLATDLADSTVELQYFDVVFEPHGGAPVMRRRAPSFDDITRAEGAIAPLAQVIDLTSAEHSGGHHHRSAETRSFNYADSVSGDETTMYSLDESGEERVAHTTEGEVESIPPTGSTQTIDLTGSPSTQQPLSARSILTPTPDIRQGATFLLERLPLLFDPLGSNLTSISDEMFAVNNHVVLVEKLPERRRRSPFEERNRFRWDTSPDRIELLDRFGLGADGSPREIHLFVETERQDGFGVYIGMLRPLPTGKSSSAGSVSFTIVPTLDNELHRLLRKGRIPEHIDNPTVDFGTLDV